MKKLTRYEIEALGHPAVVFQIFITAILAAAVIAPIWVALTE